MDSTLSKTSEESGDTSMVLTARNLVYLMSKKSVDIAGLSAATELGTATIGSLRRGIGNPTLSTLVALAKFFNVSLSELTEVDLAEQPIKSNHCAREIPLIKINDLNKFIERRLDHYDTYLTEVEETRKRSYFAVLVNNDSLHPQFSTGTVFIVCEDEEPYDGDTVLVKIGPHAPCFRKILVDGEHFLFLPMAIDSDVSPSLYPNYKLLGVVLKAIKTFSER